jgi:hypothetical protein
MFTVHAHQRSATHLDLGRPGVSAGDEDLISGVLTRNGARVGLLAGSCRAVRYRQHGAVQLCEFDLRFGSAQIASAGVVVAGATGPGTFSLPISGGTGRYLGASGQIAVTATSGAALPITVTLVGCFAAHGCRVGRPAASMAGRPAAEPQSTVTPARIGRGTSAPGPSKCHHSPE